MKKYLSIGDTVLTKIHYKNDRRTEVEALEKGKLMLSTHKLVPDFLNKYGRYGVEEI